MDPLPQPGIMHTGHVQEAAGFSSSEGRPRTGCGEGGAQQIPVVESQPPGVTQGTLASDLLCDLDKPLPFLGLSFLIYQTRMG